MITSIAEIRARHAAPPASAMPAALQILPPPRTAPSEGHCAALHAEGAEWVAMVAKADITRLRRADGGYELHVGRRRVVLVEPPDADGRHVVVNLAAGRVRSPALARNWADTLALRIARNEALA